MKIVLTTCPPPLKKSWDPQEYVECTLKNTGLDLEGMSIYQVFCCDLNVQTYLVLSTTLFRRSFYYPYFTHKDTEARGLLFQGRTGGTWQKQNLALSHWYSGLASESIIAICSEPRAGYMQLESHIHGRWSCIFSVLTGERNEWEKHGNGGNLQFSSSRYLPLPSESTPHTFPKHVDLQFLRISANVHFY